MDLVIEPALSAGCKVRAWNQAQEIASDSPWSTVVSRTSGLLHMFVPADRPSVAHETTSMAFTAAANLAVFDGSAQLSGRHHFSWINSLRADSSTSPSARRRLSQPFSSSSSRGRVDGVIFKVISKPSCLDLRGVDDVLGHVTAQRGRPVDKVEGLEDGVRGRFSVWALPFIALISVRRPGRPPFRDSQAADLPAQPFRRPAFMAILSQPGMQCEGGHPADHGIQWPITGRRQFETPVGHRPAALVPMSDHPLHLPLGLTGNTRVI